MNTLELGIFFGCMATCVLSIIMAIGWRSTPTFEVFPPKVSLFFSVIVPVRNEEKVIERLLQHLYAQRYQHFEVIVVDDYSEDRTPDIVRSFQASYPHFSLKLIEVSQVSQHVPLAPKKAALQAGIARAQGEVIVTTDGDCFMEPDWLTALNAFFIERKSKMVVGPVAYRGMRSFFAYFQAIEFASLVGSGAATLNFGSPTMCNGANLAFPKDVFYAVGGYGGFGSYASGDDEFLMHKVSQAYPGKIHFLKAKASVVFTDPQPGVLAWLRQRSRWGSKWRAYQQIFPKVLALSVFLMNATWLLLFFCTLVQWVNYPFFLLLVLAKILADFLFLSSVVVLSAPRLRWWVPVVSLLYPLFLVIAAIGTVVLPMNWKGRRFVAGKIDATYE